MGKRNWRKTADRKNFISWETKGGEKGVYVSKQFSSTKNDWELYLNERTTIVSSRAEGVRKAKSYMRSH